MTQSLFREYIAKYLSAFTTKAYEDINGRAEGQQPKLWHKELLTSEYSTKYAWDSAGISRSVVSADVVALDSPLPLKSRGAITKASGQIPKLGMRYVKRESDIKDLQTAIATGAAEAQIVSKLLADADLCIKGIEVAKELMFLQALSTGTTLIKDEDASGRGIRVDFGYRPEHSYNVGVKWGEADAKPVSDLQLVIDQAEAGGTRPAVLFIGRKDFDNIRSSVEGKQLALRAQGAAFTTDPAQLPLPARSVLREALADELALEVLVIESSYRVQDADGKLKTVKPWEEGHVILAPDKHVGRLVWSDPVEKSHPDKAAEYAHGDEGTLISVWHEREPFSEVTSGQAHAIPVIDLGAQIYLIDTLHASGKKVTKAKA